MEQFMKNVSQEKINDFFQIIEEKKIKSVFQPIVSLKSGEIIGYEALSRITMTHPSINVEEMFDIAEKLGCLWKLEKICRRTAVKSAKNKPPKAKLFINVDGNVILDSEFVSGFTKEYLHKHSLSTKDVVFEITERSDVENSELFKKVMIHYEKQGFEIAIDDLGSKYSGLNRINFLCPHYIKIDIALVKNIHESKSQRSLVSMLVRHCKEMNYTLIAEGIETRDELKCLCELGVDCGQGYYLGKPNEEFLSLNESIKHDIIAFSKKDTDNNKNNKIGHISKMGWVLYPGCNPIRAYNIFLSDEKITEIAVVDKKNHFYGLVSREHLLENYGNKPHSSNNSTIVDWINDNILVVDSKDSLKKAVSLSMMRPNSQYYDPFVVLKEGRYYGTVTIRDLLLAVTKEEESA